MFRDPDANPPAWTIEAVVARLVDAFRALPSAPVFSTPRGVSANDPDAIHAEVLSWPRRFAIEHRDARVLLMRARCEASGESVRAAWAEAGWSRSSAERAWRRAAGEIAAALNKA